MLACPSRAIQGLGRVACTDNVVTVWFGNRAIRQEPWKAESLLSSFLSLLPYLSFIAYHNIVADSMLT